MSFSVRRSSSLSGRYTPDVWSRDEHIRDTHAMDKYSKDKHPMRADHSSDSPLQHIPSVSGKHRHPPGVHRSKRHHRSRSQPMDLIDHLDQTGFGPFHHDGPYDATLASRNRVKKYSPVDAVRESTEAALRATPREYIHDSLTKHVPLQGTATVPPGMTAMSGQLMMYEEGADLMREEDAAGGAYKRWPGIQYTPDDLKGKGEPSYTIEKALKEHDFDCVDGSNVPRSRARTHTTSVEMQPLMENHRRQKVIPKTDADAVQVRARAVSDANFASRHRPPHPPAGAGPGGCGPSLSPTSHSNDADLARRHSTGGRKLVDGVIRRLSKRNRKSMEE